MDHLRLNLFLFFLLFSFSYGETVIKLKRYIETEKSDLNLSQIADIKTENKRFLEFLSGINVVKNLKPGKKITLTKEDIKNILKKNYVDPNSVKITGDRITLKRKEVIISRQTLEEKVKEYLNKKYKNIYIQSIDLNLKPFKSSSEYTIKIKERSKTSSRLYLTAFIIWKDKKKKINISVKYRQMVNAPVPKKDLLRGQIIKEEDIEIKKVPAQRGIITNKEVLLGAVVRTTLKKGKPVKPSMIIPDYPVKRRNYVKVIYDRNGIKIEITGIALENGIKGQIIKVKNQSTGKILPCKVIGKDTVLYVGGL
ncbi:flagellar basal body P-ring formation chaperone FlgA [Persephonella sp.]